MSLITQDYIIAGATSLALVILYFRHPKTRYSNSGLPLPPGPRRWPLVGSLLSLPPSSEPNWVWFSRWGKNMASDVIYFQVLGADTVVLNSREAASALLDHRSNIYSDRPHMVMASELVGWDRMLGMANYSGGAKVIRRYLQGSLNNRAMSNWHPQQEQEALRFLQKLLHSPEKFMSHIRHASGATVARLTYGYTPKEEGDEYISIAERAMDNFALATTPGSFIVDIFPLLKYIPWAPFKRTASEWRSELSELIDTPMTFVRDQMSRGLAEPSFASKWLGELRYENQKAHISVAAASLYAGGADTTVSAISTFFVAMLHYPEVQKLAQKEIDAVIGKDRLPTLADRDLLPYVEALYKEVLRWQPLAPIGIPHRLGSDVDDEYEGMRIPANAMVIANIWNMVRDPAVYHDPETFNPSRYLGPKSESNPEDVVFGFGRRRCPGINVARSSVWFSIALTLAAYDVTPSIGDDENPILPPVEYSNATVRHPKPFQCTITPRSEKLRTIIETMSL